MKRMLLTIAYDGSSYSGWQRQKDDTIETVEKYLEKGLSKLFGTEIDCVGSSRTDKGVSALGQRVTIDVETTIPGRKMPLASKAFLPDDIVIVEGEEVPMDFHVRYDVKSKTYEYKILNASVQNPLIRNMTHFIYDPLDVEKMDAAAKYFVGEHDFKAVCSTENATKTTVRKVYSMNVEKEGDIIKITVSGNGFLYNMIRIMVGTLIEVGKGKIAPEEIKNILQSRDRTKAGPTAPPNGLCLMCINY